MSMYTNEHGVEVSFMDCDLEEGKRRDANRGDNISAYYAEPFQIRWIIEACESV